MDNGDNLNDCLISIHESNQNMDPANVVDGLFAIARNLDGLTRAIRDLGNADASTPMGAIEALGLVMKEGLDSVAAAIESHHNQED